MNIDFILDNLKQNGKSPFIITNEQTYTFADVYKEFISCKKVLSDNNVGKSSVVSVYADYTPASIAMMMSLIENDCIIVPISLISKNTDRYLEISESEYLIDMSNETPIISTLTQEPQHPLLLNMKKQSTPGLILFSSGTTGEPKAALHDLAVLLQKFKTLGKTLRTITFLLFDHIGGFNTLFHTLSNAGTIVTIPSRDVDVVCAAIEEYKVELLPTSPSFLNMMIISEAYKKYDLSSLKVISYGTEPMPKSTLKLLNDVFPHCKLKQTYGLSELGIMSTKSESSTSLWMKVGGDGFETKIVDEILYIRAKSAMIGYLNAPSPFDEDGWFNTNDKVEVRGEYIRILGRITDIINVGGEKVYPIEVESILLECDGVKDARVFGEANAILGNTVVAEICVDAENNNRNFVKTLRLFCVERLERYKIPSKFKLVEGVIYGDRFKKKR